MYYIGTNKDYNNFVFYSKSNPKEETYKPIYLYITGGYKTKIQALCNAHYLTVKKVYFVDARKKNPITEIKLNIITT